MANKDKKSKNMSTALVPAQDAESSRKLMRAAERRQELRTTDLDGDHPTLGIIASASATLGERAEILSFEGTAPSTFTAAAGATPVGLHAKIKGAPRK